MGFPASLNNVFKEFLRIAFSASKLNILLFEIDKLLLKSLTRISNSFVAANV